MASRLKPTRIEHVVDGERLRAQLSAAALDADGDPAEQRRRALDILRQALFRGRIIAKDRLESGAGGTDTARLLSGITDEVISALYAFTTVHIFRARNPTQGERLALVAVGGYGRGGLAPFSDIDLLFLRPYKQTPHAESVIEYMLYALWDLGFKVGHASRTVDECLKLAREDFTIRTSLLEARHLTGDEQLSADLIRRFRKELADGTGPEFVAAKLKERDERHARAGTSRYLVEPNVKEGKGGLRDLNTLFWIARYLRPTSSTTELVRLEEFTSAEVRTFNRAFDFLWAVRAHLHFATGRAEERLSFDLQPEIARRMGYGDRGDAPAVERFMRRYFLIAREVGTLTRTFCAKLEQEQTKKPQGLSRLLPQGKARRKMLEPGFVEDAGRLNVEGIEVFERDPVNLLRLFRLADARALDLHPDAFSAALRAQRLITHKLRRDPRAAKVFLDILARGREPYRVLTLMNEAGILGRYIPEFGRIVAQMQFNMYHSYTVDEHTLRALGVIAEVAAGRLEEDHPLSVQVMDLIDDREALFLAMLLHDTGKGGEDDQETAGARASRIACERLGLAPERVELVAWLVGNHLAMSDYAQKRDVADPSTIAAFAQLVQNPERLRLLLVLTVADIRAVGPGVWNGWKGQLMRELYFATEAVFRGGRGSDPALHFKAHQTAIAKLSRERLLQDGADPAQHQWATEMEDAYFTAFTPEEQAMHFGLIREAALRGGAAAAAEIVTSRNAAEIAIAAKDRKGLFADLAGVIASFGANVVGAKVYTSHAGDALDVFYVQDTTGAPYGGQNRSALDRLVRALEKAGLGEKQTFEARRQPEQGRAAAFDVAPTVVVDNETSTAATVVEVSGRDRPGLLEHITRTFADAGVSIQSAHIDSYGERAVDAFYLTRPDGAKLAEGKRMTALKQKLIEVLTAGDAEDAKPRLKLERARASVAR